MHLKPEDADEAMVKVKALSPRVLAERLEQGPGEPLEIPSVDCVRDLLGSVESGIPDLGQRHREHLLRRLKRVR